MNADQHPLMSRMPLPEQDKRSVIPLDVHEFDLWLAGTIEEAKKLVKLAAVEELFDARPAPALVAEFGKPEPEAESG
jgi:hypothetical protein